MFSFSFIFSFSYSISLSLSLSNGVTKRYIQRFRNVTETLHTNFTVNSYRLQLESHPSYPLYFISSTFHSPVSKNEQEPPYPLLFCRGKFTPHGTRKSTQGNPVRLRLCKNATKWSEKIFLKLAVFRARQHHR